MISKYILLWLEANLQSWGCESKASRRDTQLFPTKSGVTGLLLCAKGASGEQIELLERLAPLRQTVVSYVHNKSIRQPPLKDFHMVGSGYNPKDPWESLNIPRTSNGDRSSGSGAKITQRYYLQDSKFAAIVEVPEDLSEPFAEALISPVFSIYLGRKCCIPTDFIFRGVFDSENEAILTADEIAKEKQLIEDFRVVPGVVDGVSMTLNDIPVRFGEQKLYRDRKVTMIRRKESFENFFDL